MERLMARGVISDGLLMADALDQHAAVCERLRTATRLDSFRGRPASRAATPYLVA